MQVKTVHRLAAAIAFVVSTFIYLLTMAPTMSFWDCGEFIACSYILGVPHPPGSPLFLLVGHLFTFLPFGDPGWKLNLISVLSSGVTVMLTYLIIVHLVRQWKGELKEDSDWYLAIFSGLIGAFTFAFTHSFWFNAVETEVYAASMLFTALVVWLILVWSTKADEPGNERYLLLIAYIIGLAIGVHLLNVLAIPFVALIFFYKHYELNIKNFIAVSVISAAIILAIYPGMVIYLPQIALSFGFLGLGVVFVAVMVASYWAIRNHKHVASLIFSSMLLIMIGYSTYSMIYIRSGLDPAIDENDPETVERFIYYMKREQYGEHTFDRTEVWKNSQNSRQYDSAWDFFWKYQINKMYNRYFLWQFVGMGEDEASVDPRQFLGLPLLLGLIGVYWHARRDPKRALAVFALFFMTGIAIVLYLNQPDPQPRERDYSYVGSFFAFSLWVGLGYAGVMELLKEAFKDKAEKWKVAVFLVLMLIVPAHMLAKNYESHDRSGNYVAWDYSYNMLISCEPDAILFTNGDNDTFPLWYLQEVEHVRKDVRIVNLSLLNTDWYIKQLRDWEPRVPMRMSDFEIERVGVRRMDGNTFELPVPKEYAMKEAKRFQEEFQLSNVQIPDKIKFKVTPPLRAPDGTGYLRTQDWMIMNILAANKWRRPIYFAVTVPKSNMLGELYDYFRMDGLVMKLVPFKNWQMSPPELEKNLLTRYKYRNLNNPDVYFNWNIKSLLQNYRSAFLQLTDFYAKRRNYEKAREILEFMNRKISPEVIPWTNRTMHLVTDAFRIVTDSTYVDSLLADDSRVKDLPVIAEHVMRLGNPKVALPLLEKAYELEPTNPRTLATLINAYQMTNNREKIIRSLENWLKLFPDDQTARRMLNAYQKQE